MKVPEGTNECKVEKAWVTGCFGVRGLVLGVRGCSLIQQEVSREGAKSEAHDDCIPWLDDELLLSESAPKKVVGLEDLEGLGEVGAMEREASVLEQVSQLLGESVKGLDRDAQPGDDLPSTQSHKDGGAFHTAALELLERRMFVHLGQLAAFTAVLEECIKGIKLVGVVQEASQVLLEGSSNPVGASPFLVATVLGINSSKPLGHGLDGGSKLSGVGHSILQLGRASGFETAQDTSHECWLAELVLLGHRVPDVEDQGTCNLSLTHMINSN